MQVPTRVKTPFMARVALQFRPVNDAGTTGCLLGGKVTFSPAHTKLWILGTQCGKQHLNTGRRK